MSSASGSPSVPSAHSQAVALWSFVNNRFRQLSLQEVAHIASQLPSSADATPKQVAEALKLQFAQRRLRLKNTHALEAASLLLGHPSWQAARRSRNDGPTLIVFDEPEPIALPSWSAVSETLCNRLSREAGGSPRRFRLAVGERSITVAELQLYPAADGRPQDSPWPWAVVNVPTEADWTGNAAHTFERFRRHLEESSQGVLDGYEVLRLGASRRQDVFLPGWVVGDTELANSELVVTQEDNPLSFDGFEIARGDELACWHQLLLALRTRETAQPAEDIRVDEADGAWRVGDSRFVWTLNTVFPRSFAPLLRQATLNLDESLRLKRRFDMARDLFGDRLVHSDGAKRLQYLGNLPETCPVNLHRLLNEISRRGSRWDEFCEEHLGERIAPQPELQLSTALALFEALQLTDPSQFVARPPRNELVKVENDALLRTLLQRVDQVSPRLSPMDAATREAATEAVEEFASAIGAMRSGIFRNVEEMPHLVHAYDADDLRGRLEQLGLTMFVGVVPAFLPVPENLRPKDANMLPWAIGNKLVLDIDVGGAQ